MITECISLLTGVFIHLSIVGGVMVYKDIRELVPKIAILHGAPIALGILSCILSVCGATTVAKVFMVITLLSLGYAVGTAWRLLSRFLTEIE